MLYAATKQIYCSAAQMRCYEQIYYFLQQYAGLRWRSASRLPHDVEANIICASEIKVKITRHCKY